MAYETNFNIITEPNPMPVATETCVATASLRRNPQWSKVHILGQYPKSRLDPRTAYDAAVALELALREAGVRTMRSSPHLNYGEAFRNAINDCACAAIVSFKLSNGAVTRSSKAFTAPLLISSTFDYSMLPDYAFRQLEFYSYEAPRWLTEAHQAEYYAIKRGISPITIKLGKFLDCNDLSAIERNVPKVVKALTRALDLFMPSSDEPF